jgi:hypothetical protein
MKLNDILDMWNIDSKIDDTDLKVMSQQNSSIPNLHSKYLNILCEEKMKFYTYNRQFKELKSEKRIFYIDGPTPEQHDTGWKLPAKGKIPKMDVEMYMNADSDLNDLEIKLNIQTDKIAALESIIKIINNMNFLFKNILDTKRFSSGD